MRRFFNLDYENLVVVSHEDISKDITKKNGQNITRIAPNIQDAIANKIAGMVDIVARVVVEDDDSRTLNFKQNEVIFGGGRLKGISQTTIPLSWDALMDVYDQANQAAGTPSQKSTEATQKPGRRKVNNSTPDAENAQDKAQSEPQQASEPVEEQQEAPAMNPPETEENQEQQAEPEKPKTRVRKRRGEN